MATYTFKADSVVYLKTLSAHELYQLSAAWQRRAEKLYDEAALDIMVGYRASYRLECARDYEDAAAFALNLRQEVLNSERKE